MGRERAPCRPEHLGEVVFIWDLSDNDLCLTSIFGGTASINCGSRFPRRNGTFRHSFGQIIPTVRRSPSFSHAQSLPGLQLFMLRSDPHRQPRSRMTYVKTARRRQEEGPPA
jgi:hypothetical protein